MRNPRSRIAALAVAGAVAGGTLGIVGVASAQDTSSTTTPSATGTTGRDAARAPKAGTETALTGETADKVTAAAVAAVPGATVERVETDDDGSPFEAHITKSDGTRATVKIDASYAVTAVEDNAGKGDHAGGPGGHGGRGGRGGAGETALTGATADQVKAAALAAVPGGTVERTETDNDGSPYEAHVTKADGTKVTVKVDASFRVTSVDAN